MRRLPDMENKYGEPALTLTVLGTRGSMPVEGRGFSRYGGATSCYLVRAGRDEIYLDAGSGIVSAVISPEANVTLLMTHMHIDHLVGLPFFPALGSAGRPVDIYAGKGAGLAPKEAIDRLISPPFWPCHIDDYPASVRVHEIRAGCRFAIGEVDISTMEGTHPGGAIVYRLDCLGKSIVYATDFEHTREGSGALARFAAGCDVLLYDAQYTRDEYDRYKGYGHSTPEAGLRVADEAGAVRLLFVHHAPWRRDETLSDMERAIAAHHENASFAKTGDEIEL